MRLFLGILPWRGGKWLNMCRKPRLGTESDFNHLDFFVANFFFGVEFCFQKGEVLEELWISKRYWHVRRKKLLPQLPLFLGRLPWRRGKRLNMCWKPRLGTENDFNHLVLWSGDNTIIWSHDNMMETQDTEVPAELQMSCEPSSGASGWWVQVLGGWWRLIIRKCCSSSGLRHSLNHTHRKQHAGR